MFRFSLFMGLNAVYAEKFQAGSNPDIEQLGNIGTGAVGCILHEGGREKWWYHPRASTTQSA